MVYGLRRSSLIMGVHPGCPVCSVVAASLVAVETDVGETISATKVTFVCGLWSVGVVAFLSAVSSSCFCIHHFFSPFVRCWFRVLLHIIRSAARSSQDSVLMKVLSCLSCTHPRSAAVGDLWISFQTPTHHRECLLVKAQN